MKVVKQDFYSVKNPVIAIQAPLSGKIYPQEESNNPLVKNQLLGLGVEVEISNYQLFAPFNGSLIAVKNAGLEFIFKSKAGLKLLVKIHLDEQNLPMTGFKSHVRPQAQLTAGELVASFDFRSAITPPKASITLLEHNKLSKLLNACYYQASRVTAPSDTLFKLTKRTQQ